ncbi:MAG: hypothetical protein ACREHV_11355 [Rhizomicrobium sp.]
MSMRVSHCAIRATALLLGGCAYAADVFGTSGFGEHPSVSSAAPVHITTYSTPAPPANANSSPTISTESVAASASTGTIVGQKMESLRADLARPQVNVAQHRQAFTAARESVQPDSQAYFDFDTVARINARLRDHASNPNFIAEWN